MGVSPPLLGFDSARLPYLYSRSLLSAPAMHSAFEIAIAVDHLTRTNRAYLMVRARCLSSGMAEVGVVIGAAVVEAEEVAEAVEVGAVGIAEVVMEVVMPMRPL